MKYRIIGFVGVFGILCSAPALAATTVASDSITLGSGSTAGVLQTASNADLQLIPNGEGAILVGHTNDATTITIISASRTNAASRGVMLATAGGLGTGASGTIVLQTGTPANANGSSITLMASAGVGTNRDGGNIVLSPGAKTGSGIAGFVSITVPTDALTVLEFVASSSDTTISPIQILGSTPNNMDGRYLLIRPGGGGTANTNASGKAGGSLELAGGDGSDKNGSGTPAGAGGSVFLRGGDRGSATGSPDIGIVVVSTDSNIDGLNSTRARNLLLVEGGLEVNGTARLDGGLVVGFSEHTIASSGDGNPATVTIAPTGQHEITCSDADGCNVTLDETGAVRGRIATFVNIGTNTVNFADTAGVSELATAFAAGQYDTITVQYISDRWVELARSNN